MSDKTYDQGQILQGSAYFELCERVMQLMLPASPFVSQFFRFLRNPVQLEADYTAWYLPFCCKGIGVCLFAIEISVVHGVTVWGQEMFCTIRNQEATARAARDPYTLYPVLCCLRPPGHHFVITTGTRCEQPRDSFSDRIVVQAVVGL